MPQTAAVPNDLQSWWMPFTANRQFKANPRLLVAAKDMHYTAHDGRQILDGIAGLWAVNAGHCRQPRQPSPRAPARPGERGSRRGTGL